MSVESKKLDFKAALAEKAMVVNSVLEELGQGRRDIQGRLREAIRYTRGAPGKRIRAAVALWCCELIAGSVKENAKIAAGAIEMVHTYSLVHDDLPAMDDDDMRRGQASCHKAFGEACAILTGDALLTLAFEMLAEKVDDSRVAVRLISVLAGAAGGGGMIAGQMSDLENQNRSGGIEILENIHTNKTAKMFGAAAAMGAIAGGGDEEQIKRLWRYGLNIGLGFQVADDILDVSGSSEHLGKTAGKDVEQGKMTYPSIVGMEESKRVAEKLADEARAALEEFGPAAEMLRQLAVELLERTR